jgi:hypothetical protein
MEREPAALTDEAVTRLEAADEALEEGTADGDYDGCRFCEVGLVLELVVERLAAAGHADAVAYLAGGGA